MAALVKMSNPVQHVRSVNRFEPLTGVTTDSRRRGRRSFLEHRICTAAAWVTAAADSSTVGSGPVDHDDRDGLEVDVPFCQFGFSWRGPLVPRHIPKPIGPITLRDDREPHDDVLGAIGSCYRVGSALRCLASHPRIAATNSSGASDSTYAPAPSTITVS
jgi:hypothetical protein